MASLFSHPLYPLSLWWSGLRISRRLLLLCIVLTILPDADVIAFRFGIPYASPWGHRGFTHSIFFSLIVGVLCVFFQKSLQESPRKIYWWTMSSTLSHALLDALTNGGLGVALFWPLTPERFFFPWRPIEVSPIGAAGFLSWRGLVVLFSELMWLWIPFMVASRLVRFLRKRKSRP